MELTGSTIVHSSPPPTLSTPAPRLAELVAHLTECNPRLAVAAVNAAIGDTAPSDSGDRLAVVAQALLSVKRQIDLRDPKREPPAS